MSEKATKKELRHRLIYVAGCDNVTKVVLDLDDAEYLVAQKIAEAVTNASVSGCMPVMETYSEGEKPRLWPKGV